jgi:hypothetical protein
LYECSTDEEFADFATDYPSGLATIEAMNTASTTFGFSETDWFSTQDFDGNAEIWL